MKVYVDFHIHSALSPCGDEDMTPNNIVNMAMLKGLDAIAITDHNSCENAEACIEAGKRVGLIVIPGIELQTKEDIHIVCLFRNIYEAYIFQEYVFSHLPPIDNNENLFGAQLILDRDDNIIGKNPKLLLTSANITFDEAFFKVQELNGAFIPAHVDKESFSVISNIGFVPEYLPIGTLEYHSQNQLNSMIKRGIIKNYYNFIKSSDAHYLEQILEREFYLNLSEKNIDCILDSLNKD
jgi:PHP family Zn ribbon phosphoesterase